MRGNEGLESDPVKRNDEQTRPERTVIKIRGGEHPKLFVIDPERGSFTCKCGNAEKNLPCKLSCN